jgi:hypothetical protein
MSLTQEIFSDFASAVIADIRATMQRTGVNATGKTSRSLAFTATDSRLQVTGGVAFTGTDRLSFIESGRGPTNSDQGGVLYPAILEWVNAKNIGSPKQRPSIARAITRRIHQGGTRLWKNNKQRDIVQENLGNDRIAQLYGELGNRLFREVESQVIKKLREGAGIR